MAIREFPDPCTADENGLLAVGGDLYPDSLLLAYRNGIFPWPMPHLPLMWFSPPERAILKFSKFHVARSLVRALKKLDYKATIDQAFDRVIVGCATMPGRKGDLTWITPELMKAYQRFHRLGHAHSVEIWLKGRLVGGVYGVAVDGVFAGESMFRTQPNASKIAILHLVEHLKSRGVEWMDIQVMTPHMKAMGAELIKRDEYLALLARSRKPGRKLF